MPNYILIVVRCYLLIMSFGWHCNYFSSAQINRTRMDTKMVGVNFYFLPYLVLVLFYFCLQSDTLFTEIIKSTVNTMKPTKVECSGNPKRVANFTCSLKARRRGVYDLSGDAVLLQPLRNISVRFEAFMFYNGFRSFIPNTTEYYCEFMAGRRRSPLLKIATNHLKNNSNLNTTCPIENNLIVRGFQYDPNFFPSVFPKGKYKVRATVIDDTEVEPYVLSVFVHLQVEEHNKPKTSS